jgi:hypothetical protein
MATESDCYAGVSAGIRVNPCGYGAGANVMPCSSLSYACGMCTAGRGVRDGADAQTLCLHQHEPQDPCMGMEIHIDFRVVIMTGLGAFQS